MAAVCHTQALLIIKEEQDLTKLLREYADTDIYRLVWVLQKHLGSRIDQEVKDEIRNTVGVVVKAINKSEDAEPIAWFVSRIDTYRNNPSILAALETKEIEITSQELNDDFEQFFLSDVHQDSLEKQRKRIGGSGGI